MSAKNIKRRERLWIKDKRCYWCKIDTVLHANFTDDQATIEHLWSRMNPLRKKGKQGPIVLACRKCNMYRSSLECSILPLYVEWVQRGREGTDPISDLVSKIKHFKIVPPDIPEVKEILYNHE